ncbi:MAG: hypothetical protein U5L09_04065 [Bacteroidales bacterium]|nr:hypothetical protein [Bacteroidales bacterium]
MIQHPETYVFASNLLFNLVLSFVILLIGIKVTKYAKDYRAGLLLQLGFFANSSLLTVSGRLLPEGFMLLPLGLMIILMIKYLYDEHPEKRWRKHLLLFSLLIGWGWPPSYLLPFFLIPLVILQELNRKLALAGLSLLAFIIIAFPVISHLDYFWNWTSNMFIHSGNWGHGKANFMNFSQLPHRLSLLYNEDKLVFILLVILLIENLILGFIKS